MAAETEKFALPDSVKEWLKDLDITRLSLREVQRQAIGVAKEAGDFPSEKKSVAPRHAYERAIYDWYEKATG